MKYFVFLLLAVGIAVSGCAPKLGEKSYNASEARVEQRVEYGTVRSVRTVRIEGGGNELGTAVGTAGGGVVGGVLGSLVGGGAGKVLTTVGGAILGTGAGYFGSQALQAQDGLEITVEKDGGGLVAITQAADVHFQTGQRVRILSGADGSRVTPF
jgi:outer membrane lipoprotein SlyB